MKTSFANTFQAIEKGDVPKDRIHNKPSVYDIEIDESPINKNCICVVKSFENISTTENQSRLLVDPDSKEEYDNIYRDIHDKKQRLIIDLNRISGIKKEDIERALLTDFEADNFYELLAEIVEDFSGADYKHLKYSELFNADVVEFLKKPNVQADIQEYVTEYNKLLDESTIFSKGVFNPTKAENVINALKDANFFPAGHTVKLSGIEKEFNDYETLRARLIEERKAILENPKLLSIEQQIKKVAVIKFQEKLESEHFTVELSDLSQFKRNVWRSYLIDKKMIVDELVVTFESGKKRLQEIEELASGQITTWDKVIETFNDRFFVPFKAFVSNKQGTVLGKSIPLITFKFLDEITGEEVELTETELERRDVLSQGEKRAMYLMNIIFKLEDHKTSGESKLYIIDDIADSFDYKNKYAIIQYLEEISESLNSKQIILTHNYDFFRTIQSRILTKTHRRSNSFIADKIDGEVILMGNGNNVQVNPFQEWIKDLGNAECLLASLPFVRNLMEFKGRLFEDKFTLLTALLHEKPTSSSITIADIRPIFNETLSRDCEGWIDTENIVALFENAWSNIIQEPTIAGMDLRKKVILSIGIRVQAERYMLSKITDLSLIRKNQTAILFKRFKSEFQVTNGEEVKILDKVNLITPENIHLNSFMFEPILDLSMDHLKQLYSDVINLT
jgi:energy-coupling factor transporter ATP-binding protein EcfA2